MLIGEIHVLRYENHTEPVSYIIMGPSTYMWSTVDWNVVMRRMALYISCIRCV